MPARGSELGQSIERFMRPKETEQTNKINSIAEKYFQRPHDNN